jgi:hypothetical protein
MKTPLALLLSAVVLAPAALADRVSGGLSFYGIVERVVFEPAEENAERIQVWGAFAYVDPEAPRFERTAPVSNVARGYLYFRVRSDIPGFTTEREVETTRREWKDLKAVAGTGQAIGFGSWGYIGSFGVLDPAKVAPRPSFLWERKPSGGALADLRVRPAAEKPADPATYQTETGIVKLSDTGSHAEVIKRLRAALQQR